MTPSCRTAEHDAMIEKVSTIGDDLSKSKPALNKAVKTLFESAARTNSRPAVLLSSAGGHRSDAGDESGAAELQSQAAE